MYEDFTYSALLNDALAKAQELGETNTEEGTIVYSTLAPACWLIANVYMNMSDLYNESFISTCSRPALVIKGEDYVLPIKDATYAQARIEINSGASLTAGDRFYNNGYYWYVDSYVQADDEYIVICETPGTGPNTCTGDLTPVTYIDGLTDATFVEITDPGENEEDTEAFRARLLEYKASVRNGGSEDDYIRWAKECDGIGDAKVFPLWNGDGTVKVVLVSDTYGVVDSSALNTATAHIESKRVIGATVTTVSATSVPINVSATVTLNGVSSENVENQFETNLNDLIKKSFGKSSISYAKIGNALISIDGVEDYDSLLVNSGTSNVTISETGVATVGTITLTEGD